MPSFVRLRGGGYVGSKACPQSQSLKASMDSPNYILFFSRAKGERERRLSNFFPARVEYRGVVFPAVENAFQAAKFLYSTRPELFRTLVDMSPAQARSAGSKTGMRRLGAQLIDAHEWDRNSVAIMKELVERRMHTDAEFRAIVEAARRDGTALLHFERSGGRSRWGGSFPKGCERAPENFVGQNLLGKIMSGSM